MRLSLYPFMPEPLVASLQEIGIRTDSELIFSRTPVEILQLLPPGTVSMQDLQNYITHIAAEVSAIGVRGDQLLIIEDAKREHRKALDLGTGVHRLDALLGDLNNYTLLEVSGEKGSGKTALASHIALRHLIRNPTSGVLWMDTTGDFSTERMADILQSHEGNCTSTVLQRLQVALVLDIEAAHDMLEALPSVLTSNSQSDSRINIIVIDSVTPLLAPMLSPVSSQGHAIMTTFMRQLRALGQSFGLTIFVINNAVSIGPTQVWNPHSAFSTTKAKPALGPSFTFLTDGTVWMSRYTQSGDNQTHIVEVFRSKTHRSRTWCSVHIRNGVLLDS